MAEKFLQTVAMLDGLSSKLECDTRTNILEILEQLFEDDAIMFLLRMDPQVNAAVQCVADSFKQAVRTYILPEVQNHLQLPTSFVEQTLAQMTISPPSQPAAPQIMPTPSPSAPPVAPVPLFEASTTAYYTQPAYNMPAYPSTTTTTTHPVYTHAVFSPPEVPTSSPAPQQRLSWSGITAQHELYPTHALPNDSFAMHASMPIPTSSHPVPQTSHHVPQPSHPAPQTSQASHPRPRAPAPPPSHPSSDMPAGIQELPQPLVDRIMTIIAENPAIEALDFDSRVVRKMVTCHAQHGEKVLLEFLRQVEERLRSKNKYGHLANGAGYLDTAITMFMQSQASGVASAATMSPQEYAQDQLPASVYQALKRVVGCNKFLNWDHFDAQIVATMKRMTAAVVEDRLESLRYHSFSSGANIKSFIVSLLIAKDTKNF